MSETEEEGRRIAALFVEGEHMKLNQQLLEIIRHCRCIDSMIISEERGDYEIEDGKITLTGTYLVGQWIHLQGSVLNDGVYSIKGAVEGVYSLSNGTDNEILTQDKEAFTGVARGLRIDSAFITLAREVLEFNQTQGKPSALTSESFGKYSYTRATDANGMVATWKQVFATRLHPYRMMFSKIRV